MIGAGRWERALDISRWIRQRLRERLSSEAQPFSYVVPAGLGADVVDEEQVRELIDGVLDLVLTYEPTPQMALLEVARCPESKAKHAVYTFHRKGGTTARDVTCKNVQDLARRARRIGADVRLDEISTDSMTALVTLATR